MLRDTLRDEVEKEYTYFYGYQPDQSVVDALDNMTEMELQDELTTMQYEREPQDEDAELCMGWGLHRVVDYRGCTHEH
tara:strand:- start:291 stop:524 length:234 start_codon:yes stop_codon:yes gene_type:complete